MATRPAPEVDFHLLIGDETALPAISAALRAMPEGARGAVYAETGDASDELEVTMRQLRPYLRKERGIPAALASISGYWRHGRTEEAFRSWKRDLAAEETATTDRVAGVARPA